MSRRVPNLMWRTLVAVGVAGLGACSAAVIEPDPPSGELIAFGGGQGGPRDACFLCHGRGGEGTVSGPSLAGQRHGYLLKQLEDYASGRRFDPVMEPIAARLDDRGRRVVSGYYAALDLPTGAPGVAYVLSDAAATLYHAGSAARNLAPCAECHGDTGQGGGQGDPALRGLDAAYVAKQLRDWKSAVRRNDGADEMGDIARALNEAEIEELSIYIAGLRLGPPT